MSRISADVSIRAWSSTLSQVGIASQEYVVWYLFRTFDVLRSRASSQSFAEFSVDSAVFRSA